MIPAIVAGGVALAGAYANYKNNQNKIDATKGFYNDISDQAQAVEDANARDIGAYKRFMQQQYGGMADRYEGSLQDFLNSPVYQNPDFQYQGTVEEYLDPARDQRVAAAMDAINEASATGANRFSSDWVRRTQAKAQALASDEWKAAYDRLTQARQQQLAAYNANSQNGWNNYNATTQKQQYGINAYGVAKDALTQGYGDALTAGMNNRTAGLQSQANALAGIANTNNQEQSFLGQLAGPAAQFMGSYFGGGAS